MRYDEMISETITGFDLQEPAVAYLDTPPDTELFFGDLSRSDYVADGNYRLSQRDGVPILFVNARVVACDDYALQWANLLGPWKPCPRYWKQYRQDFPTWLEARRAHWIDQCDVAIKLAELPQPQIKQLLDQWNARHPLNELKGSDVLAAKRRAEHILYQSDDERDGESATGRNRPTRVFAPA